MAELEGEANRNIGLCQPIKKPVIRPAFLFKAVRPYQKR